MPTPDPKKRPRALRQGDRTNFATLLNAARNGNLALVSAIRKSDGAHVALVCAMDSIDPVPVAVMIEGNPYDAFEDPTA